MLHSLSDFVYQMVIKTKTNHNAMGKQSQSKHAKTSIKEKVSRNPLSICKAAYQY